jgi:hypothetical protein
MHEIWTALITGFASKAGAWMVMLVLIAGGVALVAGIFVLHALVQALARGRRAVHVVFRFIELHLLGLVALLLGAWSGLTAVLSVLDGPHRGWLRAGTVGTLASGLHLLGVVVWVLVGLMALRLALALVGRAYKRSSYA